MQRQDGAFVHRIDLRPEDRMSMRMASSDFVRRPQTVRSPALRLCAVVLASAWFLSGCLKQEPPDQPRKMDVAPQPIIAVDPVISGAPTMVHITLGQTSQEDGLRLVNQGDGATFPAEVSGVECRQLAAKSESYLYLAIDPAFKDTNWMDVLVTVEFYAPERGLFDIQYDGRKPGTDGIGAYSDTPAGIQFDGAAYWNKGAVMARGARFENRQNGGADLRLRVHCREFYVRRVTVTREPTEAAF
jgi:hypothetical protein